MRHDKVYTSPNIISLVIGFILIFVLLYSLASFLHESKKIHDEIELIKLQNEKNLEKIEEKKRRLAYLKTPQRVDKEAKMQMGKKRIGENVLIFIEEKLDILPPNPEKRTREDIIREDVPLREKWKWIFFGKK